MSKLKRKLLGLVDRMIGTTNVEDYDNRDKQKAIEEVNAHMNRAYINQLNKEINRVKHDQPQDYDFNYVDVLEQLVSDLKVSQLKQVKVRAKQLRIVWKNHSSKTLAYSYFLSLGGF